MNTSMHADDRDWEIDAFHPTEARERVTVFRVTNYDDVTFL